MQATEWMPTTPGTPEITGKPATVRTSGTKGTPSMATMPATTGMLSTAVAQAAAVTPGTSNRKDDSNSMIITTAWSSQQHDRKQQQEWTQQQDYLHIRGANNRRDAKVVKPATACREANNNLDTITFSDNSSNSREASNITGTYNYLEQWQQSSLQQQRHHRCQQQKGDASNSWHATTVLPLAGTPTATVYMVPNIYYYLSMFLKGGEKESRKESRKMLVDVRMRCEITAALHTVGPM
jgi:hypothetical protein